jgi:hypothetical protein
MRNSRLTVAGLSACLSLCSSCETKAPKPGPRSDGQIVHWSKVDPQCVTTIMLLDTLNATNRTELPGGTNLFYFTFEGRRAGKDLYNVGIRYPVGRSNETAVTRQVGYDGHRIEVTLGAEDIVIIEPRRGAR